ncbi:hypothetical protein HNO92_000388 [Chromobacterium alkanivorans]|nr:hypothetical protein [Chromobacterium alkanivorans]MCS3817064.1 hypothetical protein [Chromobacterium alkanivorans]MCS3872104.1 hypothetical protein [Chromobacterium alkanivorans]
MNVSEAKRLNELETESMCLKKLLAETMIAKETLRKSCEQTVHGGNWCAISWGKGSVSVYLSI